MDLCDYPRPKGDTGIGVHWIAGFPAAVGLGQIRDFWLPELQALGVKWVKLTRHDGGQELIELLLRHDIMPIVRLYRPQTNPGVLDKEALATAREYAALGVHYFEFNNEPDLAVEWQNSRVPPNAVEIVARNAIADIEAILKVGGYPGIPAMTVGSKWDLVGEICRQGRRDLFGEPVWQAVHNYSLNHPLDYPYDVGNQTGAAYTQEFYDRLLLEGWDGAAWGGWSLDRVNQERRDHSNPGANAFEDPSCWRAYERYDRLIRDQIGRSLPILATENGYIVSERQDPRYPATTPQLHAAQTLEACRIMMGTSTRFDHAPDYYFCTAFWLLANYNLGHWAPEWEGAAWYSGRWPGEKLPIVDALKAEPKRARVWRGDAGIAGQVSGLVQAGAGLTVRLARADGWTLTARAAADGRFAFADVPLGEYTVTVVEAQRSLAVTLSRERPIASANFDVTTVSVTAAVSVIRGRVTAGAGRIIRLARPADNWAAEQTIGGDETYRFSDLSAGVYVVALAGADVARAGLTLDGRNEIVADLVAPGWGWTVSDGGASPGFGVVRCRVTGRPNHPVRLWTVGWQGMTQRTGSKPEYGPDVCEFAPLGAGRYALQPEGVEAAAEVTLDGSRVMWVTYTESAAQPARASIIAGYVRGPGNGGRGLTLTGPDAVRTTTTNDDGTYRFDGLPPGIYRVAVDGASVAKDGLVLDGQNRLSVDLELPPQSASIIRGSIANGAGRRVRLLPAAGATPAETQADSAGSYRFERLTAGVYSVAVMESAPATGVAQQRSGVAVDGDNQAVVDFELPAPPPAWRWSVEDGGPGPGFALVRCRVIGEAGREVRLWTSGWGGVTQRAGSKPEYGPDACEFAPLGPGVYWVEPAGLAAAGEPPLRAEVRLAANRVAWVRFEPPAAAVQPAEPPPVQPPAPTWPPAGRSVIAGAVRNGEGLTVVLRGPGGTPEVVTTVTAGGYRFESLTAGTYRVAIRSADPAAGELAARADIVLDGTNLVAVDFDLPAAVVAQSRVIGRVKDGAGRTVILEGPGGTLTTVVAADETYGFSYLPPGVYRARVQDGETPAGAGQMQTGIQLDGRNTVRVDFDLNALEPGKTSDHYLLVGSVARSKEDFLAVLRYVGRFQPIVGGDEIAARKARHVTILGSLSAISALVEQGLRMSGCQVRRIEGNYAEELGKLLDADQPF